ncbi:MAG TPA: substrate-binding domain-containing protein [Gemmatimonadaceae bacterium]|nr:substrate-binding domain-containing protein [Gemmatimonadaceae bacterium]
MSIKLFSALAVRKALEDVVLDTFTGETGIDVERNFDPTVQLLKRIDAGEQFDVMIGVTESFDALDAVVDRGTITPLAKASLGLAVAGGATQPDISTESGFVAALVGARSVAYSRSGASGIYFGGLIERLDIADVVRSRATQLEKGFAAEAIVDGRADMAIQQLSELMFVPAVDIVGPFPASLQQFTDFSAVVSRSARNRDECLSLVRFLSSRVAKSAYLETNLTL